MPVSAFGEHGVEFLYEPCLASHQADETVGVVGHIPGVMARCPLGDETLPVNEVGIVLKASVLVTAIGISRKRVDDIAPVVSPFAQQLVVVVVPQGLRHLCHGKVVEGILQRPRGLLIVVESLLHPILHRYESILEIRLQRPSSHAIGIFLGRVGRRERVLSHVPISLPGIEPPDALHIGVGQGHRAVVANHCRRIGVPAREDGQPSTLLSHPHQRLHHMLRKRGQQDVVERMEGAVGVPHREVGVSRLVTPQGVAIGKAGIEAVGIAEQARQERGTVERAIELVDLGRIGILHVDGMEPVYPCLGGTVHHLFERHPLHLSGHVFAAFAQRGERRSHPHLDGLSGLAVESHPCASIGHALDMRGIGIGVLADIAVAIYRRLREREQQMSAEARLLAPSLIDAVHGVGHIHLVAYRVEPHLALVLVAVGIDHHIHPLVAIWRDPHDGPMERGRDFYLETLARQLHRIVMRMRHLLLVTERRSPLGDGSAQFPTQHRDGGRPIVLGTSAHQPVRVAESLEERVGIVVGRHALLLRVLCLGSPEVLSVGHEHGRQRLSMFLAPLSEESGRRGIGLRRSHHRVDGVELCQVSEAVDACLHHLPDVGPPIEMVVGRGNRQREIALIVQEPDEHVASGIAVEHHLQVGSHGQYLVHASAFGDRGPHQGQQIHEVGVVAEPQVGPFSARGDGLVGLRLDLHP